MKRTFIPMLLCAAFGLLLVACGGSDTSTNTTTSNTANTTTATSNKGAGANTTTANTTTTNTTTTTSSGGGEKIGVAECDELITKYETCVNSKVPEAQRAQYKPTLDQWRSSWKNLAANPATRNTLAGVCKSAIDQARTSMKSYGCDF